MPKRFNPKTLRAAIARTWAFYQQQQRQLDADAGRLLDRNEDDTPDAIVDAMNADLLARFPGEGRRVIWIHGRPHPDPGDDPEAPR